MTTMELKAIRMQAELMKPNGGNYQIRNSKGIVMAFDLTLRRAREWSRFHADSRIEDMSNLSLDGSEWDDSCRN